MADVPLLPRARIVHSSPGRLRLRLAGARADAKALGAARDRLMRHKGVRHVHVNWRTGSVLILGDVALDALASAAREEGLFTLARESGLLKPLSDDLARGLEAADGRMRRFTGGRLGVVSVVIAVLVGVAVIQFVRGKVGTPAETLLWYAFSALLMARAGGRPALA